MNFCSNCEKEEKCLQVVCTGYIFNKCLKCTCYTCLLKDNFQCEIAVTCDRCSNYVLFDDEECEFKEII